ncbi:hypothetical protein N665_1193s0004 [Sinapis alba]|nr:hypothetical protein N665_1193s0004 [Sinapis alba]
MESLKEQYLTIENLLELWTELNMRYDHQRTVILPKAIYDWTHLRIQDYKTVDEYNSALFKIVSKMKLCGEIVTDKQMLEKTFSTFHASNVLLQQQYREKGFKTYGEFISCLLLAEQNNELLMRNSEMRPPGSKPLPEAHNASKETKEDNEANHVQHDNHERSTSFGRGRGRGNYHGRGRGRGGYGRGKWSPYDRPNQSTHGRGRSRGRGNLPKPQNPASSVCHRCGMSNHWAKNCRTPKHLVDLYQGSLKEKNPEAHMVYNDDEGDFDHEINDLMDYETSDCLKD